jgi:hypothetical protein
MAQRTVIGMMAIVATVSLATDVHAHWWHQLGRSAGLGWSDGYHSRTECPPKGAAFHSAVPWQDSPPSASCPSCVPTAAGLALPPAGSTPAMPQQARTSLPATGSGPPARPAPSWSIATPIRP